MAMLKFSALDVLQTPLGLPAVVLARQGTPLVKDAHRHAFAYTPRPGYLYVRSRAISSRCNDNFDEFPADEIKQAHRTFVGKPVFVNHRNENHRRARGVIVDAALHEDRNPDGSPDTWVEVLMEVDAVKFPKLAKAIMLGHIDRTSMGTDVAWSECSACGNRASTPLEYCDHIPRLKGKRLIRRNAKTGQQENVLIREICHGLKFFENSLLVEPPADPTAYTFGLDTRGLGVAASIRNTASRAPNFDALVAELQRDVSELERLSSIEVASAAVGVPYEPRPDVSDRRGPTPHGTARMADCGSPKVRTDDRRLGGDDGCGWGQYCPNHPNTISDEGIRSMNSRKLAYNEVVAPPEVDTLRDDICPVCGERDTYNGDECAICGFKKPPQMFMDPDVDVARQIDLRQDQNDIESDADTVSAEGDLVCPNCGAQFNSDDPDGDGVDENPEAPEETPGLPEDADRPPGLEDDQRGNEGGEEPNPEDESGELTDQDQRIDPNEQGQPQDPEGQGEPYEAEPAVVEQDPFGMQLDPRAKDQQQVPPGDQQAVPGEDDEDVAEDATAPQEGDPCPECGKGILQSTNGQPDDDEDVAAPVVDAGADDEDADADEDADEDVDKDADTPPWLKDKKKTSAYDPTQHEHWPLTKPKFKGEDKTLTAERKNLKKLLTVDPSSLAAHVYGTPSGHARRQHEKEISSTVSFIKAREKGHERSGYERLALSSSRNHQLRGRATQQGEGQVALRHHSKEMSRGMPTPNRQQRRQAAQPQRSPQQPANPRTALHDAFAAQQRVILRQEATIAAQSLALQMQARMINRIASLAGLDGEMQRIAAPYRTRFAALRKRADEANPANPIPEPPAEPPVATTEDAISSDGNDDVMEIGASPVTDVSADAVIDVSQPYGTVANDALDLNEVDVTAPVDGTQEMRPENETITFPDIQVGSPDDPNPAFPLQGDMAQPASTYVEGSQRSSDQVQARFFAAQRLARLRIQSGIERSGDDLVLGQVIASGSMSDGQIATEIETLAKVLKAQGVVNGQQRIAADQRRRHVPQPAGGRQMPPMSSTATASGAMPPATASLTTEVLRPSDDEFAFD